MCDLQFSPLLYLVVLFACMFQCDWAEAVVPVDGAAKVAEIKRFQLPISADVNDAVANADAVMANNNICISDSQIVLAAQDKKAAIKAIAGAVLAKQTRTRTSQTGMKKKKKTVCVIPMPVAFPASRDAFLYYVSNRKDALKSIVRLGRCYSLSDWKLYRALIAPSTCEAKRTAGDYYC